MSTEELRRVRDTLIEELRRSETLTVAGRALFARYSAVCETEAGAAPPPAADPEPPARPPHPAQAEDDDDFGGSFMVRPASAQSNIPGYRDTPSDLPRSLRDRRR